MKKGYHSQLQTHYSCRWSSSLVPLLSPAWCFLDICQIVPSILSFEHKGSKWQCWNPPYPLMMRACSSIKLPSPMTMGPASAMMRAFGWTTVLGPETTTSRQALLYVCELFSSSIRHPVSKSAERQLSYQWWRRPLFHSRHKPRRRQLFWRWNKVQAQVRMTELLAHTASIGVLKKGRNTTNQKRLFVCQTIVSIKGVRCESKERKKKKQSHWALPLLDTLFIRHCDDGNWEWALNDSVLYLLSCDPCHCACAIEGDRQ